MSNVLLFGDQTAEQYPLLRKTVLRTGNASLSTFLERSSIALREEIKALPRQQRARFPDFMTINNLLDLYYEKGDKIPMLESAFITIAQLGHYIGYFSEHPEELPSAQSTRVLGLCTGLLAAAAVVSAKNVSDLVPLAVDFVRMSFRSGAIVNGPKSAMTLTGEEKASWSTICTGTTEPAAKKALDAFHKEAGIPISSQAYVSAVSVMAITISGPPSTTKRFFESGLLAAGNRVSIPVFAPYHAEHLYTEAEITKVIGEVAEKLEARRPASLVHSAATGKAIVAENSLELVKDALSQMLQKPDRKSVV